MKTTIKLSGNKSLTVEPSGLGQGGVKATIAFEMFGIKSSEALHLTQDQCGALLFALETAADLANHMHDAANQMAGIGAETADKLA